MTSPQLRAAEAALAAALTQFDRAESEVSTYSAQLAEATANEKALREQRDLDGLTAAVSRRIALENLLAQAQTELEPARDRLHEAELAANRERAIVAAIPCVETVANTEGELIAKLEALEAIIGPALDELVMLEDRLTSERSAYYRATSGIDPRLQPGELVERGGQKLPRSFDVPIQQPGVIATLPLHPLGPSQSQSTPIAWKLFHSLLSRRLAAEWKEQKDREALERIGKRPGGYDPYAYQGGKY